MANNSSKSFKWSRNTTLLLISLIDKSYNQLQSGIKKYTFKKIAQEINEQYGTDLSYDQVESKWKGLRRTYKKVKESKTELSWEYYHAVDEILKDDIEINPLVTVTSEEPFVTGREAEFDFVEYVVEPAGSSAQQSRKRRRSSDGRYERDVRRESSDEERSDMEVDLRQRNCYEDRSGRKGRSRHRSSDNERSYKELRKRRSSDESRQVVQGNRNKNESTEEARERRHQEKMKLARRFLDIFEQMVDKM